MRRRSILAASAASVLCLCTILAGTALASPAGGIKGDPQPNHKPFRIAGASTTGGIALNGNSAIVAYGVTGSSSKIVVCAINLGQRKCSYKTVITTPDGGTLTPGGVTGVFRPSAGHIAVLQNTCCDNVTNGDTLLYTSTNDGKSFGAPVRVGNIGVGAAVLIGHDIAFIVGDVAGTHVESIPDSASGPPASTARLTATQAVDVGIGEKGGALLAGYDTLTSDYTTYADYAAAGANFNAGSSYHKVAFSSMSSSSGCPETPC